MSESVSGPHRQAPAEFICSAAHLEQLPQVEGAEFCIMGRSNVGKSSFINHVLEQRGLAKVSKKPGKTTLANLFRVAPAMHWVDLPGYGYARASQGEKERWSKLIADYCARRRSLCGVLWLLDIRHPVAAADQQAWAWMHELGLNIFPVFTKCDKLTRNQVAANRKLYRTAFSMDATGVSYSTERHESRQSFWDAFLPWSDACIANRQA